MKKTDPVAVFGGDARMLGCAEALRAAGAEVCLCGFEDDPAVREECVSAEEALRRSRTVVLPMPVTKDGVRIFAPFAKELPPLDDALALRLQGHRVLCGMAERLPQTSAWQSLHPEDYCAHEGFLTENARITAEAALYEAMTLLSGTLYGTRCLVAGFGRVGKALTLQLCALHARVTVLARAPGDRALARTMGAEAAPFGTSLPACTVVFNTVPHPVFCKALPPGTKLCVELASAPGVDPDLVDRHGAQLVQAAALPAKYAPEAAGAAIAAVVLGERKEEDPCTFP